MSILELEVNSPDFGIITYLIQGREAKIVFCLSDQLSGKLGSHLREGKVNG